MGFALVACVLLTLVGCDSTETTFEEVASEPPTAQSPEIESPSELPVQRPREKRWKKEKPQQTQAVHDRARERDRVRQLEETVRNPAIAEEDVQSSTATNVERSAVTADQIQQSGIAESKRAPAEAATRDAAAKPKSNSGSLGLALENIVNKMEAPQHQEFPSISQSGQAAAGLSRGQSGSQGQLSGDASPPVGAAIGGLLGTPSIGTIGPSVGVGGLANIGTIAPPVPQPTTAALVQTDETEPHIVEVFYGTNRARLTHSTSRYLSPFGKPILFLVLLLILPRAVRAVIKEYLHRVAINLVRVALVLLIIYYGLAGYQTAALRWQKNHMLEVQYGPNRLEQKVDGLTYELGICEVSIPPVHEFGDVELPELVHFEFSADPTKHFVLSKITPHPSTEFYAKLREKVAASPKRDLFVFVHGFHNTFQKAAFRTAQLSYDLGFNGAPVMFSWPSQGKVLDYRTDENNVEEATQHLKSFLIQLKDESHAERIHVIAHSMGSRALSDAVMQIGLQFPGRPVFNEMLLAAPDLDAGKFKGIAKNLTATAERVTLYASSKDKALMASNKLHGGTYKRAGESLPTPVTVKPVESIDVSQVSGGHSYISNSGRILNDLRDLLIRSRQLNEIIAQPVTIDAENRYWILR